MPDAPYDRWTNLLVTHRPLSTARVNQYVVMTTFRAFGVTAVALTGLFSLLEFVEQLAYVGQGRYHVSNALLYVVLTMPSRLLQATPISMLLGSLLGLGALARHSELTAMLSLGIPQGRIIRSILAMTVPIIAVLFLLAQFVIPAAQQEAHAERNTALHFSQNQQGDDTLWAQSGQQYLNVRRFDPNDVAVDINIYAFQIDNSLASLVHADKATIKADGTWLLSGVSRKHVEQSILRTDRLPSLAWHSFLSPQQLRFLNLPIDSIPPVTLYQHIQSLERLDQNASRYEEAFWAKVSIPLSIIAMILIVAPYMFGAARLQNMGRSLVFGIGFGIVFSLAQQILDHVGLLLNLWSAVTALSPPLAVILVAAYLLQPARFRNLPG